VFYDVLLFLLCVVICLFVLLCCVCLLLFFVSFGLFCVLLFFVFSVTGEAARASSRASRRRGAAAPSV